MSFGETGWKKRLKHGSEMNEVLGTWEICGSCMSSVPPAKGMSSRRCPCSWQGGWNQIIFKVPSNPNHSMILRFYVRAVASRMGNREGTRSREGTCSKIVLFSKKVTISYVLPPQTNNCSPSPISQVLQSANQTNTGAKPTCNLNKDACR